MRSRRTLLTTSLLALLLWLLAFALFLTGEPAKAAVFLGLGVVATAVAVLSSRQP